MSATRQRPRLPSRESAKAKLVEMIDNGEIRDDSALSERVLAERMGISRTPIREALQDLARDGIFTVHPARGAFLKSISLDEMRDLYEVRLGLEGVAAYRAAATGNHRGLADLLEQFAVLQDRAATPALLRQAQDLGDEFHLAMFQAAGNAYLLSLYDRLRLKIRISLRMTREHDPDRVVCTIGEHMLVLQAILDCQPTLAQQSIDKHLRNGFEARVRIYSKLPYFTISGVSEAVSALPGGDNAHRKETAT